MRGVGIIGLLWATAVFTAHPQPLVVAGSESEQQLKKAEQLIEQTRKKDWDRTKWEAECRKASFEVVGSEQVVYLIPIYHTPAFVDRVLIPLIESLLKQPVPVARLDELESALQEALSALTYRPSISLSVTGQLSGERMRTMLSKGEMLISLSDSWWFFMEKENESEEFVPLVLRSKRFDLLPSQVAERLSPTSSSPPPTSTRLNLSEALLGRWHFLFSTSLSVQAQVEQMQAYLQRLQSLRTEVARKLPSIKEQLRERLYPKQSRPVVGDTYALENISELAEQLNLDFTPPDSQFAHREWRLREWRMDIEFVVHDGSEIRHIAIPLEVLLGL